uniref:DH domain-containing protein n=1 Tax=Arcella intermedia TaxID=1963864 RepID=A0A6B2KXI1_9EUKA
MIIEAELLCPKVPVTAKLISKRHKYLKESKSFENLNELTEKNANIQHYRKTIQMKKTQSEEKDNEETNSRENAEVTLATRDHIINEIISTEKTYGEGLQTLTNVWQKPLQESLNSKKPFITQDQINSLFPSISTLYSLHLVLFEKLKKNSGSVGKVFLELYSAMKLYIEYIIKYDYAMLVYGELSKNKNFRNFDFNAQTEAKGNLLSYLITPIQRLPRYQLLLESLLKHTEQNHPDYNDLKTSLDEMRQVNILVNQRKREHDKRTKLFRITNAVKGMDDKIQLNSPSRSFIHEGLVDFYKMPNVSELSDAGNLPSSFNFSEVKWIKGFLYLLSDMLLLTTITEYESPENSVTFYKKIDLQPKLDIKEVKPMEPEGIFQIGPVLFLPRSEEKQDWVGQIQKAISSIQINLAPNPDTDDAGVGEVLSSRQENPRRLTNDEKQKKEKPTITPIKSKNTKSKLEVAADPKNVAADPKLTVMSAAATEGPDEGNRFFGISKKLFKRDEKKDETLDIKEVIETLVNETASLRESLKSQNTQFKTYKTNLKTLEKTIESLSEANERQSNEIRLLKDKNSELESKLTNYQNTLTELHADKKNLLYKMEVMDKTYHDKATKQDLIIESIFDILNQQKKLNRLEFSKYEHFLDQHKHTAERQQHQIHELKGMLEVSLKKQDYVHGSKPSSPEKTSDIKQPELNIINDTSESTHTNDIREPTMHYEIKQQESTYSHEIKEPIHIEITQSVPANSNDARKLPLLSKSNSSPLISPRKPSPISENLVSKFISYNHSTPSTPPPGTPTSRNSGNRRTPHPIPFHETDRFSLFLSNLGYSEFQDIFRENGINTVEALTSISPSTWNKLGVKKVFQAQLVLKAKEILRKET